MCVTIPKVTSMRLFKITYLFSSSVYFKSRQYWNTVNTNGYMIHMWIAKTQFGALRMLFFIRYFPWHIKWWWCGYFVILWAFNEFIWVISSLKSWFIAKWLIVTFHRRQWSNDIRYEIRGRVMMAVNTPVYIDCYSDYLNFFSTFKMNDDNMEVTPGSYADTNQWISPELNEVKESDVL